MSHWTTVALGDVLTLHYGKPLDAAARGADGAIPVFGANGIKDYTHQSMCRGPSLVVGRKGSAGEINRADGPFWPLDVTYFSEHDKTRIELRYLEYLLRLLDLPSLAKGVKPGINRNEVYAIEVPLPPMGEQKRIVAALDQAFAALDHARASIEANASDSAGLTDAWLKEVFESNRDWPVRRLGDVCENLDRDRVPITKADRKSGDVPYYGASGVVDYVKDFLFDEELLLVSEDGANLLARTYPIAFSIRGRSWVNNHAHVLRFSNQTTQEFVRLYLNSISLRPFVTGMAQPKLNQGALNSIPVPVPPTDVQATIVALARGVEAASSEAITAYKSQFEDIAALRQSLLRAAFTGQLS